MDEKLAELFDALHFHPDIVKASRQLFIDGYFAQAIFEAFKMLEVFVKEKSREQSLNGLRLMARVFDEKKPILKLNDLSSQSEIDEQAGFKFLYMGAMRGIRNPKAHEYIVQDNPFRTLKYLAIASLLVERVEESKY